MSFLSILITTSFYAPLFRSGKMAVVHGRDTRALIMGHSHVFWLRRFIESAGPSWPGVSSNFAVDGHGCRVHYIGVCGARLPYLRTDEQWERTSILRPQLVVLHQFIGRSVPSASRGAARGICQRVGGSWRQPCRHLPINSA